MNKCKTCDVEYTKKTLKKHKGICGRCFNKKNTDKCKKCDRKYTTNTLKKNNGICGRCAKSDNSSSSVPKVVKLAVWKHNIGDTLSGNCYSCNKIISYDQYECGHIVSVRDGGSTEINNLKPICKLCNRSSSTMNLNILKKILNQQGDTETKENNEPTPDVIDVNNQYPYKENSELDINMRRDVCKNELFGFSLRNNATYEEGIEYYKNKVMFNKPAPFKENSDIDKENRNSILNTLSRPIHHRQVGDFVISKHPPTYEDSIRYYNNKKTSDSVFDNNRLVIANMLSSHQNRF